MLATRILLATVLILSWAGVSAADDALVNPEYAKWSKFKPGTSIRIKSVTELMGTSGELVLRIKLVETTADKLVLEMAMTSVIMGQNVDDPPSKRDVLKKRPAKTDEKDDDEAFEKAKGEEGTETLKISGVEYKCKWKQVKASVEKVESITKVWTCDEIPGGVVKMESSITGGKNPFKSNFEVVDVKKE
jgi:hypothetical protein